MCTRLNLFLDFLSTQGQNCTHRFKYICAKGSKMAFSLARSRTISISSMIMIDYSGSFSARIKRILFDSSHWIDHYSAQWEGPKNLVTI